ncbi:MAG: hypothetical protein WKG07_35085 [Hymenobacter sp.]
MLAQRQSRSHISTSKNQHINPCLPSFSRIVSGELPAFKVAEDADHLASLDLTPLVEATRW